MFFREMGKICRYGTEVHVINYKAVSSEKRSEIGKDEILEVKVSFLQGCDIYEENCAKPL